MLLEQGESRLAEAATSAMSNSTMVRNSFSSWREVSYSCGSCGYELYLTSSNRNTSNFGSKYGKTMKKGFISFLAIDESRFSKKEECRCIPDFFWKNSRGIFRRRAKLLCQKCGNFIGIAYEDDAPVCVASEISGAATRRKYKMKIRALQPMSDDEHLVPLSWNNAGTSSVH